MEYIRVSKENLEEHYLIYRTLVRQCSFLALRAYLWVKSVAEMPVKPLHC